MKMMVLTPVGLEPATSAPEETQPQGSGTGVAFSYILDPTAPNGTWTVLLTVTDNFGITYSVYRPLSAAYRAEALVYVPEVSSFFLLPFFAIATLASLAYRRRILTLQA
jgi:hypothetical protein